MRAAASDAGCDMSQPWVLQRGRRLDFWWWRQQLRAPTVRGPAEWVQRRSAAPPPQHHLRHGDPDPLWTGKLNTDCLCGARYKICRAGLPHRTGSGLARGLAETVLLVNTLLREQNDFNHLRTAVLGNDKVVTENYISQNKVTNIREHADAEHRMFPKVLHFIF